MINLNDRKIMKRYDRSGMLKLLEDFPEQCSDAKRIGMGFEAPSIFKTGYRNIVITGLGGSAIGADILRSYIADDAPVPILVNRNYTMPAFVGEESLVVASSYSGNTEETISSYKDARRRRAKMLVITSGGRLKAMARADKVPFITIPAGLPPRCALGYSFFPLLIVMSKLGVIGDRLRQIEITIRLLKEMAASELGPAISGNKNIAKSIANSLYLKYPIIYGGQDHIDSVVTRWRGQIAENSKALSSSHIFPEMNHNEIVGWQNPKKLLKEMVAVILRDSDDHPRTAKRMDITKGIIRNEKVKVIEVHSLGEDLLSRIFSLIYIGDFTSYYLAILYKTDPAPVDRVAYLKKELAAT